MLQKTTLHFLDKIKKNNNKEWMDANRGMYEAAKNDFEGWVAALIAELGKMDPDLADLQPKHCTFRLNRDIRFSKDKSPYKTNFGAAFSIGGKKSPAAGYYFHLEPGSSFAGGGIWMPEADILKKIRQEVDYNAGDFKKIVTAKKFKDTFGKIDGEQLSRPPKGYEESNPMIEYIKLKSFTAGTSIPDTLLTDAGLLKETMSAYKTLKPLIDFLNRAVL